MPPELEDQDADILDDLDLDTDLDDQDDPDIDDADPDDQDDADDDQDDEPSGGRQQPTDEGRSRGGNRIQRLANENRDLKTRLERLERGDRTQQSAPARTGPTQAEVEIERARVAAMPPEERAEYIAHLARQEAQQGYQSLRADLMDREDRRDFESLCARSPIAARLKDRVEQDLQKARAQGINVSRDAILKHLIGERALQQAPRAQRKQQRQADQQRQRQQARPGGGSRSDVAPNRGAKDERQARAERLKDVPI